MSVIWSKSWLRAICCLLLACSAAVAAADDVLKLVPDNALGVVVVNRVGATNEKLKSLRCSSRCPVRFPEHRETDARPAGRPG